MREIKFRAWDKKFRQWVVTGFHVFGETTLFNLIGTHCYETKGEGDSLDRYKDIEVTECTGLPKNDKDIYEGDIIRIRRPYRTTQTHTGDNIPNGSYTEPMEAEIETIEVPVIFRDGCFCIENEKYEDMPWPLIWEDRQWTLEEVKDAISWSKAGADFFDDPEEGDLQYLLSQYKLPNSDALLEYISGVEIIGNIYAPPPTLTILKQAHTHGRDK